MPALVYISICLTQDIASLQLMPFPMRYLHIYSFWVSSYPRAKILHDIVETALFRQCILSVSTYWRYMALSIPRLWQSVDLKPHVPASHLPFALLHSRTMPLSITISDCCPCCGDAPPEDQATLWTPDILRATLEVLTPHAARWSSLSFMLRDHSLVGLLAMHVDPALPLPELRTQQFRGYAAMPRNYTVFAHSLKAHPIAAQITALDLRALACHAGIYSATLDLFFWSWPTLERLSLDFNTLSPGYWRALCSSHQGCVPALRHLYVMEISPLDVQEFVFLRLQVPLPLP